MNILKVMIDGLLRGDVYITFSTGFFVFGTVFMLLTSVMIWILLDILKILIQIKGLL